MRKKTLALGCMIFALGMVLAGCGNSSGESPAAPGQNALVTENSQTAVQTEAGEDAENAGGSIRNETEGAAQAATELTVRFGDEGDSFTMHLYDNDTAAAIARHVGTSDWRLPIYHYDDYDNWEVMQYYDIPSRYDIPSDPEEVTTEAAGTVYYSEPNRIILFYQDGEVSAEYTPVGYFDYTDDFLRAVEENPVLEGWGNKIVCISDGK